MKNTILIALMLVLTSHNGDAKPALSSVIATDKLYIFLNGEDCRAQVQFFGKVEVVKFVHKPNATQFAMTGPNENKIVLFPDGSTLTMQPNSKIIIDEYVYNPNPGFWQIIGRYWRGGFRFISGHIPKDSKSNSVCVGIRG